jgi:hemolysin activation/secretion protein
MTALRRWNLGLIIGATILLAPSLLLAQVNIPSSVEAGRVPEKMKAIQEPGKGNPPLEGYTPLEVPKGAENIHFVLKQVVIEGVHAYSPDRFVPLYNNLWGQDITLADMYTLADHIRRIYYEDGYILTQVFLPQQKTADGSIKIHVTEGYISRLRWAGFLPDPLLSQMADEILAARPFDGKKLENIMLRLNDVPGTTAQAALEPLLPGAPEGAAGLVITVDQQRLSASFSTDDYASRYLGVWEGNAKVQMVGVLTPLDSVNVMGSSSATPSSLRYTGAQYNIPINDTGTTLTAGITSSFTNPQYQLAREDIVSQAQTITFGVNQPLLRSREQSLDVSTQFGISNQQTDAFEELFTRDRIRTITTSAIYKRSDNWGGANLFDIDIVHGMNIWNATQPGSAFLSRAAGRSDFTKAVFNASRMQTLPGDFSLFIAGTGQQSSDSLLTSQQFGFGGPVFGRAYDPSEIIGDNGIAGSAELRWQAFNNGDWSLQPFAFYDIGVVDNKSSDGTRDSGASAGFGARAQWGKFFLDSNIAWPLTRTPEVPKLGATDRDPRINVAVGKNF